MMIRNRKKFYITLLLSILIIGCSDRDLISVSNEGRLVKISDIYSDTFMSNFGTIKP